MNAGTQVRVVNVDGWLNGLEGTVFTAEGESPSTVDDSWTVMVKVQSDRLPDGYEFFFFSESELEVI